MPVEVEIGVSREVEVGICKPTWIRPVDRVIAAIAIKIGIAGRVADRVAGEEATEGGIVHAGAAIVQAGGGVEAAASEEVSITIRGFLWR